MEKMCKECGNSKPLTRFSKEPSTKNGYRAVCKDCRCKKQAEYRASNRDTINAKKLEHYYDNRESLLKAKRDRYSKDPDKYKDQVRNYVKNNPEKKISSVNIRRNRIKRNQPKWTCLFKTEIENIHKIRREIEAQTGRTYHVDHIIPLTHSDVVGLDVPWNMQILTASENTSKSNQFDGTYENESWRVNL